MGIEHTNNKHSQHTSKIYVMITKVFTLFIPYLQAIICFTFGQFLLIIYY